MNQLFAQKQTIDSVAYRTWPSLEDPIISNDGRYVMYNVDNLPVNKQTLVLKAIGGNWKMEFAGSLTAPQITNDSKSLVFITGKDSLGKLDLGTSTIKYIPHVDSFKLQRKAGGELLCYHLNNDSSTLIVKDLQTNRERSFTRINSWEITEDGSAMVVERKSLGSSKTQSWNWIDLTTNKTAGIYKGSKIEHLIFDLKYKQLAFKANDEIWYYRFGSAGSKLIGKKASLGIKESLELGSLKNFSRDGKRIFITLIEKVPGNKRESSPEIWSYRNVRLPSETSIESKKELLSIIKINDFKSIILQKSPNEIFYFPNDVASSDTLALVSGRGETGDRWSIFWKLEWSLISTQTGARKTLNFLTDKWWNPRFSLTGKFLIYFDTEQQNYFSYEIGKGVLRNLTKGLNTCWLDRTQDDDGTIRPRSYDFVWKRNDSALLINDQHDIWLIDPLNIRKPINLTNNYGIKNHIIFHLNEMNYKDKPLEDHEEIILSAFNSENKKTGYFKKNISKSGDPELLILEDCLFEIPGNPYIPQYSNFSPIKARDTEMFIVRRMSATDAPNYFCTHNFKNFETVSDLKPNAKYLWLTSELHNWKSPNGKNLQGILYKPENFNPNKKYPVIIHYYERKSDRLNVYFRPQAIDDGMNINIPTYTSNGYLIFTPDIYYQVGDPMQGTCDAVISAAEYLSNLSFVNPKKIGIQGGSFGGFQTNYLVTQTNLFAAAVSSSGVADWVSGYGSLFGGEGSLQGYYEGKGQGRIGSSLWEKPDAYIKSSPIFRVDKIITPLLLMHGKKDPICLFSNIVEFFTGLRRMGKKAWMLAYPSAGHGLEEKDADDFGKRMMQFYDHYLKDKPAPIWMTGRAMISGGTIADDYGYDTENTSPGAGLLTPKEKKKVDSLMTRKSITITLK